MRHLKFHTAISFLKSGIRIVGYVLLGVDIRLGAIILIIAEVLGIVEEKNDI